MPINRIESNKTFTDLYGDHLNNVVVIGNPDVSSEFQAHVKLEFWGENFISFEDEGVKGTPVLRGETVELDLPKRTVKWFRGNGTLDLPTVNGVLHWVDVLKERPASNEWKLKIADDNQFLYRYQTPLSVEQLRHPGSVLTHYERGGRFYVRLTYPDGAIRFDERLLEVDGSISVRHKFKRHHRVGGKNYRTGKVLHIPRPKAVDASGEWYWCDIAVEDGYYKRTIPDGFLDTAVYPITINDTFEYTSVGGTSSTQSKDYCASYYLGEAPEAGTCTSVSFYIHADGPATATPMAGALYDNDPNGFSNGQDDNKDPNNRYGCSINIDTTCSGDWADFAVSVGDGVFGAEALWAAQNHDDDSLYFRYDTDATMNQCSTWYYDAYVSGNPAAQSVIDPWGTSSDSNNDRDWSAYITYTPSGGGGAAGAMSLNRGYWGPEI